jgi:hypothetical protein
MTCPPHLVQEHYQDLLRSGLSDDTIAASQIYSASASQVAAILGYSAGPGMAIPYPMNGTSTSFTRIKLDRASADGKRYRTRKDGGNRLYIPPLVDPARLADPSVPVYLTEGEKKTLKANQEGLLTLGLAGVWNWRTTRPDGRTGALPEFDTIPWTNRPVYIVYDSDPKLSTTTEVHRAEAALAEELAPRGAQVFAIHLPADQSGVKVAFDDYLVRHSVETFCALEPVLLAPAAPPRPLGIGLGDFLAMTFPPQVPYIPDLLSDDGGGWISGEEKLGKTHYVLEEPSA